MGKTDGVYQPGQTGIDGLYRHPNPPPDFVVTEAKFGKGQLRKLTDGTKQMSNDWVEERLAKAVDPDANPALLDEVERAWRSGRIDKYLVKVQADGTTTVKQLNDKAHIIGNVPGF